MALYGQERWILGYYGKNIYLNHEKIEEKKLKLADIQELVSNFMLDFEGVQYASPAHKILNANSSGNTETCLLYTSLLQNMSNITFTKLSVNTTWSII